MNGEEIAFNLIDAPKCDLGAIEKVISSEGFDFSMKDCNGKTLLQKTVLSGDTEILKLVLKKRYFIQKNLIINTNLKIRGQK